VKIEILDQAVQDLIEGFHFYEGQQPGLALVKKTDKTNLSS
jgi:hypothetical protein